MAAAPSKRVWLGTAMAVALTAAGIGYQQISGGGGGGAFAANLYASPVVGATAGDGSTTCTRSTSAISYAAALSGGNVCKAGNGNAGFANASAYDNACKAAQSGSGGTIIGVKAGEYDYDPGNGIIMGAGQFTCGQTGSGDADPNGGTGDSDRDGTSAGSTSGWAVFKCADGETARTVTTGPGGGIFAYSDLRAQFYGSCFWFGPTVVGVGGSGVRTRNIQFIGPPGGRLLMSSFDISGAQNVLFQNVQVGPNITCGKNDANVTSLWRCQSSGVPLWESQYASWGTTNSNCGVVPGSACGGSGDISIPTSTGMESYIHQSQAGSPFGIKLKDVYFVDQQSRDSNFMSHPGCILMSEETNYTNPSVVLDHIVCERVAVQGIQLTEGGVVVENSVFSCPVDVLKDTAGYAKWDQCNASQTAIGLQRQDNTGGTFSNVVIRYNAFLGNTFIPVGSLDGTAMSNIKIIGNIIGGGITCGVTGVTYNYNDFYNGATTCGSNAQTLTGDPFVQSSQISPGDTFVDGSLLNVHRSGSVTVNTVPFSAGADYSAATDADSATRTDPTHRGPYN